MLFVFTLLWRLYFNGYNEWLKEDYNCYTAISPNIKRTGMLSDNIDELITMQCSAGKPRALAFTWVPLDTYNPYK